MLFRLVRPMRRKGSRNRYYVKRIPVDLRRKIVGATLAIPVGDETHTLKVSPRAQAIRISLRTHDPAEVKQRQAEVDAYLENVWRAYREDDPISLTNRQATALSGELYRAWANGEGRERVIAIEQAPGGGWQRVYSNNLEVDEWGAALANFDRIAANDDPAELEKLLGPIVDRLLLTKGIKRVSPETRAILLSAFLQALREAFESRKRNAERDYSPDPKAGRFPEWTPPRVAGGDKPKVSLIGLAEAWWNEAEATGRKPSTYDSYHRTVSALVAFLGHGDASRVTRDDVVRFKDHRIESVNPRNGKRISPQTVKHSDLAGLKSVFGWAVTNGKMSSNPAEGVTIKLGKRRKMRRGFDRTEANAILKAASRLTRGGERPETFAAKRWVPWLLAYTGARVGEMAQLRKEDVTRIGRDWVATISPEAGTVKTDAARQVVLHPHLITLGFIKFVAGSRGGHLFLRPSRDGDVLGPLQGVKNRLSEFVRRIVPSKDVDPNHGWRHRFKTVCRDASIDPEVRDFIQGHAPRNVAEKYGEVSLKAQAKAIRKLRRYLAP
jgi:integrase